MSQVPPPANPSQPPSPKPGLRDSQAAANNAPFSFKMLVRLGKRYVARYPWLTILYIVGTLLSQTIIPVAVAGNYSRLTNFFAETAARRHSEPTTPADVQADKTGSANSGKPGPVTANAPAPRAITATFGIWLLLTLALLALSFAIRYLTALLDQKVTVALRRDLFNRILEQSPQFFHQHPAGRLLIMVTQFSTMVALSLRTLLVDPILQLIGIVTVGYVLFLRLIEMQAGQGNRIWLYFAIIALFALLSPWLVSRMGKTLSLSTTNVQEQMLAMGSFLEGALNAPEEIQTLRAETIFDRKHQHLLDASLRTRMDQTVTVERLNLLSQAPGTVVLILLIGLAVYLSLDPSSAVNPGTIMALVLLTPQFMGSVQGISNLSMNVNMSGPAVVAVDAILEGEAGVTSVAGAKAFDEIEPSLVARDLVFSYQPGEMRNVLDGVSFEVPPGKITGFVARPGQGKTTFFRLLMRLYEPQRGEIVLGGHPIRDFTLDSLRKHVVLMSQFPTFFLDTVRENFLLAKPTATDAEIEALCRETGLWSILEENLGSNPLDRQFVPGPGKSLSGGQTKLLALTRCLLRAPSVLLLDESTTGMGPKEKFPLIQTMREACAGETVLVVDHDIMWQTRFCDYFIVLSEGRISQRGTREELLATPGLFKEIYEAASEQGPSGTSGQAV